MATATTAGSLVGTNPDLATWDPTGLEWSGSGVQLVNGASISTSTGDISVTGTGGLAGAGATAGKGFWGAGIEVRGGTAVSTVSGTIHLTGTAPGDVTRPMGRNTWGVHIEEAAAITSTGATGGSISITGIGTFASGMFDSAGALGAPAVVADASGVELHAGGVVSTVGGDITIDGTTARVPANTFGRFGVAIGEATDAGVFSGVASQSGKITITGSVPTAQAGFAGATGLSDGVLLYQGGYVQTASGAIAITGHAGEGTGGGMVGVELFDDATVPEAQHSQVLSTSGTVSIVGTGGASSGAGGRNVGVAIGQGSFVATIGTGSVDIRGTGGAGADGENHGVWVHDGSTVVTVGNNAGVAISGTGGTGSASDGINIDGGSSPSEVSASGNLALNGTAGSAGASLGVRQGDAVIDAGGALSVVAAGGIDLSRGPRMGRLSLVNSVSGDIVLSVRSLPGDPVVVVDALTNPVGMIELGSQNPAISTVRFGIGNQTIAAGNGLAVTDAAVQLSNVTLSGALSNAGTIDLTSGVNTGPLTQTASGTLTVHGDALAGVGVLSVAGAVDNAGALVLEAVGSQWGSLVVNGGVLSNSGVIRSIAQTGATGTNSLQADLLNTGLLDVQRSLNLTGTQPHGNAGAITLAAGATLGIGSDYVNTGAIQGAGTVALAGFTLTNAGTLRPGPSSGTLTVQGNLALTSSSRIEIEIEGVGAGQHDVVNVTRDRFTRRGVGRAVPGRLPRRSRRHVPDRECGQPSPALSRP